MTINIESTAGAVRVTPRLTWTPHHDWASTSTHVDGQLDDGTQLDVATLTDSDVREYVTDARSAWLRGHVFAVRFADDDQESPSTLVLPATQLTAAMVREAIYRHRCGHVTDRTASS